MNKTGKFIWKYVRILLGAAAFSLGFDLFLAPHALNAGGISGLAQILVEKLEFGTVGMATALINLPLFAVGGLRIGKRFFFGSLLGMALSSWVMDNLVVNIAVDPLLAAIYGGCLAGFGVGIVFLAGASTGGADIVVRLVKLKAKNMNIGQIAITFDAVVVLLTGLVFGDISNALYTGISVFLVGKLMDTVVYGFDQSNVAMIISNQPEKIAAVVDERLGRGATFLHGQGSYSNQDKKVVVVAVYRKQIAELKELVVEVDPDAFVILQEAHQGLGDGFLRHTKDAL